MIGRSVPPPPELDVALLQADLAFARRLARSLVADASAAEDVLQDAWSAMLERPPRHHANLRAYLATLVRRLSLRRRRSAARLRRREEDAARSDALPSDAELTERMEVHRIAVDAVLALDEPYRSTILLRYLEEIPVLEIARRMSVPEETVRTRLKRGLVRLRDSIQRRHPHSREEWMGALLAWLPGPKEADAAPAASPAFGLALTLAAIAVPVLALVAYFVRGTERGSVVAEANATDLAADGADEVGPGSSVGEREQLSGLAPSTPTTALFSEEPSAAGLHGIVRAPDGRPLPDARVTVALVWWDTDTDVAATHTDADGTFALELPELTALGPYGSRLCSVLVHVSARGFQTAFQSVTVTSEHERVELDFVLERGRRVLGRVVQADGRPAPNALVRAVTRTAPSTETSRQRTATTDVGGRYELALAPGESLLALETWISGTGSGYAAVPEQPTGDDGEDFAAPELRLTAGGVIRGRLSYPDGRPVQRFPIFAVQVGWDAERDGWTLAAAKKRSEGREAGLWKSSSSTDSDGRFQIAGLQLDRYALSVNGKPVEWNVQTDEPLAETWPTGSSGLEFVNEAHRVLVAVTDSDGNELRGATVTCSLRGAAPSAKPRQTVAIGSPARAAFRVEPGEELVFAAAVPGAPLAERAFTVPDSPFESRLRLTLRPRPHTPGELALALPGLSPDEIDDVAVTLLSPLTRRPVQDWVDVRPVAGVVRAVPPGTYALRFAPPAGSACWAPTTTDEVTVRAGERTLVAESWVRGGRLQLAFELERGSAWPDDAPPGTPNGGGICEPERERDFVLTLDRLAPGAHAPRADAPPAHVIQGTELEAWVQTGCLVAAGRYLARTTSPRYAPTAVELEVEACGTLRATLGLRRLAAAPDAR